MPNNTSDERRADAVDAAALLPCPFCGSQARLVRGHNLRSLADWIKCDGCGVATESHLLDKAIAQWNTRIDALADERRQRQRLEDALRVCRAALEEYANADNWITSRMDMWKLGVGSEIARNALASTQQAGGDGNGEW